MTKRLFDVLVSTFLLLPAIVVCLLASVAIYLDMKANPIFMQRRIGRNRKPFTLIKMRTMRPETPHVASHHVGAGVISRTGTLLRKLKIDELPQLWCVLRGDMSMVGPRPCLESQIELIEEREWRGVFEVRPGITGLAQINGVDMSKPFELAELDAVYVSSRTFGKDIMILARTAIGGGQGDAAA